MCVWMYGRVGTASLGYDMLELYAKHTCVQVREKGGWHQSACVAELPDTSFKRHAACPHRVQISHGNTARHALEYGDETLAKICGSIASDEGRHEIAYQRIMDGLFDRDPDGAVLAFADMMRKQIVMPAHMMDDNAHKAKTGRSLFADFSAVAERTETYTAHDYVSIMEYLLKRWKVCVNP